MSESAPEARAEDGVFVRVERDDNPPTSEWVDHAAVEVPTDPVSGVA